MNPYERQMLVQHQTSSLLRDARNARLARDARNAQPQPYTELVVSPSAIDRVRSTWTSALTRWQHGVARAGAVEADVSGHIATLSVHSGRSA